jgi:two-component system sensor histidine kinase CpxA
MRGLLLKIFLWFWLALALIAAVLFLSILTTENGPVFTRVRVVIRTAVMLYGQTAIEIYEREGRTRAVEYFDLIKKTAGIRAALYDDQNREITGNFGESPLLSANELHGDLREKPNYKISLSLTRFSLPLESAGGKRYLFAAEFPSLFRADWRADSWAFMFRFLIAILTGGIVCFWLACYLTSPIVQLRHATRRVAGGDLSARVSSRLENRLDEIGGLAQDFNHMADRVSALLESQRRLLGDISHELRSPLTRLNLALELARQMTGNMAREELDRIERESERLNELIGQLLTLTRIESGAAIAESSEIDVARVLQEIALDADFEAQSRNCSVRITLTEEGSIKGSLPLFRSAVENVLRNAVRYTDKGTEVEITAERQHDRFLETLVISIRDHGPGVPDESLDKLFLPFYRVAKARDRQSGGAGLGLAITERAVALFGGSVKAENMPDRGLRIQITLPLLHKSK